ncbi:MAG: hypothetical protein KAS88_01040, partial [Deltaproteobacteria bacterium]|nr:hypothetical protein [Deltaproteobacteria bacterium]
VDEHKDASVFIAKNEAQTTTLTKRDLEMELGIILGGMVAEDELCGEDSKTIATAHDVTEATAKARRMVVEYGFGDIMNNTSLVELQDYAMMSGKEILDDIQKILSGATSETEALLSKNKDILAKLTEELAIKGTMNNDDLKAFFEANELA